MLTCANKSDQKIKKQRNKSPYSCTPCWENNKKASASVQQQRSSELDHLHENILVPPLQICAVDGRVLVTSGRSCVQHAPTSLKTSMLG